MIGDIYARDRCPVCGGAFRHEPKRDGLFCPEHPEQKAHGPFRVQFGKKVDKQFKSYAKAVRFLNGLRFEVDQGTFDPLDYRADTPYAFDKLAKAYLEERQRDQLKAFGNLRRYMETAAEYFGGANVKAIKAKDVKRFLWSLDCPSDKTRDNYRAALSRFFSRYLVEEEILAPGSVPQIQPVAYELAYRDIVDLETQGRIMEALMAKAPERVYLGIDLLRHYLNLRPGDLYKLTEADVQTDPGCLVILKPTKTKNKRKIVMLLDDHTEWVKDLKRREPGLPMAKFFRHKNGRPFCSQVFYKWWRSACRDVGVKVDLYGGTRHSTVTALAKIHGEDMALQATGHETNKAFKRYCQVQNANAMKVAGVVQNLLTCSLPKKKASHP